MCYAAPMHSLLQWSTAKKMVATPSAVGGVQLMYRPDNSQVVEALAQPVRANGPGDPGVGRATSVDLMGNCAGPGAEPGF